MGSHIAAAPGEQLGVQRLARGSHLSRGIEGGESAGYSLQNQNVLIIETVYVLGGIQKGVNLYNCRVVVSTNY